MDKEPKVFVGPPARYASFQVVRTIVPRAKKSFAERFARSPQLPSVRKPVEDDCCPLCKGAGFLRREVSVGDPLFGKNGLVTCQCKLRAQTNTLFGDAHIPQTHANCTFAAYMALPLDNNQRQIAVQVQGFVMSRLKDYQGHKRGLFLYGTWGLGKTGLAVAAIRTILDAGQSALYLPTYELFHMLRDSIAASQRLKQGYGDSEDRQEESAGAKLLRLIQSVTWLVLDDIGVECSSSWVIEHLYALLEGRRSKGLFTIFTSNKDARALEQKWRPAHNAEAFDDAMRIIERMGEYCTPLHINGKNLREV